MTMKKTEHGWQVFCESCKFKKEYESYSYALRIAYAHKQGYHHRY